MKLSMYSNQNPIRFDRAVDYLSLAAGFLSTSLLFLLFRYINLTYLLSLTIIVFLFSFQSKGFLFEKRLKFAPFISGIALFFIAYMIYLFIRSYEHIPEWDFIAFYLYSLAGHSGSSFYDPEIFHKLFYRHSFDLITSEVFFDEVVKVGFVYPPPTMLLLYPLGWFDFYTAFYIWQSIIIGFYILNMYLLLKIFHKNTGFKTDRWVPGIIVVILILSFPGFADTLWFSQTNSILLFFILLQIYRLDRWDAGIYLTLSVLIKPLAAVFLLFYLINRKYKAVLASIGSGVVIIALTALFFGPDNFFNYFSSPPTDRIPDFVYSEPINKSLSAVLLRMHAEYLTFLSFSNIRLIALIIGLAFLMLTVLLSKKLFAKSQELSFLVFIPATLIIYPASLDHYSLFLVPLIVLIFKRFRGEFLWHEPLFLLFILLYAAAYFNLFFLNIVFLITLSYLAFENRMKYSDVRD